MTNNQCDCAGGDEAARFQHESFCASIVGPKKECLYCGTEFAGKGDWCCHLHYVLDRGEPEYFDEPEEEFE